jgi:PII-like signaling protein
VRRIDPYINPGEIQIMQGTFLRFYVHEDHRHHRRLVWEWLLEQGNKLGIRGGSAFKAMGGFGRHHALHEARFFELAGALAVEVEFIVTPDEARKLLELLHQEKVRLFYAYTPVNLGVINPDAADPPSVGEWP